MTKKTNKPLAPTGKNYPRRKSTVRDGFEKSLCNEIAATGDRTTSVMKTFLQEQLEKKQAEAKALAERLHADAKAERKALQEENSAKHDATQVGVNANSEKLDDVLTSIKKLQSGLEALAAKQSADDIVNDLFGAGNAPANRPPPANGAAYVPDEQSVASASSRAPAGAKGKKLEVQNKQLKASRDKAEKRSQELTAEKRVLAQKLAEQQVKSKDLEEKLAAVTHKPNPKRNPEDVKPRPQLPSGRSLKAIEKHTRGTRENNLTKAQAENDKVFKK